MKARAEARASLKPGSGKTGVAEPGILETLLLFAIVSLRTKSSFNSLGIAEL